MIPSAVLLPSGAVARVRGFTTDKAIYALSSTAQYPLNYEVIGRDLDSLELKAKAELSTELRRVRAALAVKLKTAKSPRAFKVLPRRTEVQVAMRQMLVRAWEAGNSAMRATVSVAHKYADDSSFSPVLAARWLDDTAFWITDVLSDDLLAEAQRILVQGVKTGISLSELQAALFEAFVPYLGQAVGLKVVSPARLETIIRTNTTTAYNHGRLTAATDPEIARFMDGLRYSAILDKRTTEVCRFLHGKIFRLPDQKKAVEELLPPRHFNCRSVIVPITVGETIDPATAITDAEIFRAKQMSGVGFAWDEAAHPRHPAGDERGGEWMSVASISKMIRIGSDYTLIEAHNRGGTNKAKVLEYRKMIRAFGTKYIVPIEISKNKNGSWTIIDGTHRAVAAIKEGAKRMKVIKL